MTEKLRENAVKLQALREGDHHQLR